MIYAAELYRNNKQDVISFIKHVENYKIPVKTYDKCIQIITVYKAKGLEYDMVILPKLSIKDGILDAQIHRGIQVLENENDGHEIATLLPPRNIALSDSSLKIKVKKLDIKYCYEKLCVLYVALTRAKKAMYIFSEPEREKSKTIHLSTILNRLLEWNKPVENSPFCADAPIIYSYGNPSWYLEKESEVKEKHKLEPRPIKFIKPKIQKEIFPSKEVKNTSLRFIPDSENKALNIGLCIHEIFEYIGWLDGSIQDSFIDNIIFTKHFDEDIISESKLKLKEALQNIEVKKLLSRPSETSEIWCEKEFSLLIDGTWQKGRFDRVMIEKDNDGNILKATIIDYKYEEITDNEAVKARYSAQLYFYKKILSCILKIPLENIVSKLLLVNRISIIETA